MWYSVKSISVGNVLRFLFRYQLLLFHLPGIFFISLSFSSLFLFPARSLSQATLCFYFFLHIGCSPCLVICRRVYHSSHPLSRYYLLSLCCTSVTFSSFAIICLVLFYSVLFYLLLSSLLRCIGLCLCLWQLNDLCCSVSFLLYVCQSCLCDESQSYDELIDLFSCTLLHYNVYKLRWWYILILYY